MNHPPGKLRGGFVPYISSIIREANPLIEKYFVPDSCTMPCLVSPAANSRAAANGERRFLAVRVRAIARPRRS